MSSCVDMEYVALDQFSPSDTPAVTYETIIELSGILSPSAMDEISRTEGMINKLRSQLSGVEETEAGDLVVEGLSSSQKADILIRDLGCASCSFAGLCSTEEILSMYAKQLSLFKEKAAELVTSLELSRSLGKLESEDKSGFTTEFLAYFREKQIRLPLTAEPLSDELKKEVVSCIDGIRGSNFAQAALALDFDESQLPSSVLVHSDPESGERFVLVNLTDMGHNNHDAATNQSYAAKWIARHIDVVKKVASHQDGSDTLTRYVPSKIDVGNERRTCEKFKLKEGTLRRLVGYSIDLSGVPDSHLVVFATISQQNDRHHEEVDALLKLK